MPDVLLVCTANLCRSPLAERLLRRGLDAAVPGSSAALTVASAGVRAVDGSAMAADAAVVLRRRGADDRGFASRRLGPQTLADPALVLTAERWHRRAVVEAHPRLLRRSFTLLEFARLLASAGRLAPAEGPLRERLVALADVAAARRGSGSAIEPGLDDLADPVGGRLVDFEQCADRIEEALGVLIGAVVPTLHVPASGRPPARPSD